MDDNSIKGDNCDEDSEMILDEDNNQSSEDSSNDDDDISETNTVPNVYLPGKSLEEGEELVCDESAYIMLHQAHTGAPCLSFDIISDNLGNSRTTYPMTAYIVAGTQAAKTHVNSIIVMKMTNLFRTSKEKTQHNIDDDDSESDSDSESSSSDEENERKPNMDCALIKHQGCVNRIRSTIINNVHFVASWSELGKVNIWNINDQLSAVNDSDILKKYNKESKGDNIRPVFTFNGHQQEGYGMDWSKVSPGILATGDCRRDIHIWQMSSDATWKVDQRPLIGHTDSVEDLQWSPNEPSVMASCSVDKSIRIWDCRASPSSACMITCDNAHSSDVNVITWNHNEPLIASGGDDGFLHIWDLRQFQSKTPIATFKHHTDNITTVEWHPTDSTVLASGGADDQISLWDLAVEKDNDTIQPHNSTVQPSNSNQLEIENLPPQLLFIHQGQNNIKELHWHPQLPGVILSTAHSGFNVFKTISV